MATFVLVFGISVIALLFGFGIGQVPSAYEFPNLPTMMPRAEKYEEFKKLLEKNLDERKRVGRRSARASLIYLVALFLLLWTLSLYGWPMPWSNCSGTP